MPSIRQFLEEAVSSMRGSGIETPLLDAEILLSNTIGCSRAELLCRIDNELQDDIAGRFHEAIMRRVRREPLAYITGVREFYGLTYCVTPATLIPRPETEFLVETAVTALEGLLSPDVVDVGVGSGCIGISIAKCLPNVQVYGSDLSRDALEVARKNAEVLEVGDRVRFVQGDLLSPFKGMKFDLIVSNPPYIPSSDLATLQPEVSKYEPCTALDGGEDGLDAYRRLADSAPGYLREGGSLVVEIGAGQSASVQAIFRLSGFSNVAVKKDYAGIDRVIAGEWH